MDDVLLVRGFDAVNQLLDNGERLIEVHRTAQVRTLDILHDQIVRSDVVQMADVGVVERGNRAGFAGKALGELRIGHFDRDIPIQPGVMRAVHLAHSTRANGREDFVRAEFCAGRKRHRSGSAKFSRSKSGLLLADPTQLPLRSGVWCILDGDPG